MGGRPSECWFPDATPKLVQTLVITPSETVESPAVSSAKAEDILPQAAETSALTLPELFKAVNSIGGTLQNEGSGCVGDAPANRIMPDIAAAVPLHQDAY